jgi:hypothetical protein
MFLTIAAYLIKAIRVQRVRRAALIAEIDRKLADLSRPRQRRRQVITPQDRITTSYTLGKATASL